jgi:lipopolysaccharide biosynthesis glycosyltransferase
MIRRSLVQAVVAVCVFLCVAWWQTTRMSASVAPLVHVALSGDRAQWRAMLTCINSTLSHARDASRLRFHVLCTAAECGPLRDYCAAAARAALCNAVEWVQFDAANIETRFGRESVSNSAARNLSAPHNFARFYLARWLPAVDKVIWLDNDVIAQRDIALLYDASLRPDDAPHALAAVVQRRSLDDSMVRRILLGLEGKPFGKATTPDGKRPRLLDMRHGAVLQPLIDRLQRCRDSVPANTPDCFHFNAGVAVYRLDRWRERNITAAIEEWLLFLADNPAVAVGLTQPPLVFYFWEQVQELEWRWNVGSAADIERMADTNDPALDEAALLHFNGDGKPWLSGNERIAALWNKHAPTEEPPTQQ